MLIMPWWIPLLAAFAVSLLLPMKNWQSFLAAALGAGICWTVAAFLADYNNDHILAGKMARLFTLPSSVFMIIITGLTGFITGGLGGWTGAAIRNFGRDKGAGINNAETESAA